MTKALLIFTLFIFALGGGVVLLLERTTNSEIVNRSSANSDWSYELRRHYYRNKIRFNAWWSKAQGKVKQKIKSGETTEQPKIIRWQDHNGTWHFEKKPEAVPPQ